MVQQATNFPTVSFPLLIHYSNRKTCCTELSYILRLLPYEQSLPFICLLGAWSFFESRNQNSRDWSQALDCPGILTIRHKVHTANADTTRMTFSCFPHILWEGRGHSSTVGGWTWGIAPETPMPKAWWCWEEVIQSWAHPLHKWMNSLMSFVLNGLGGSMA